MFFSPALVFLIAACARGKDDGFDEPMDARDETAEEELARHASARVSSRLCARAHALRAPRAPCFLLFTPGGERWRAQQCGRRRHLLRCRPSQWGHCPGFPGSSRGDGSLR